MILEGEERRHDMEAVLDQLPVGVVIVQAPTGRVVFANRWADSILPSPLPQDASAENFFGCAAHHTDGSAIEADEWPLSRAVRHGDTTGSDDIELHLEDGTRRYIAMSAAPVYGEDHEIVAGVATISDITERKRAEIQRARLTQQKDDFLSAAAHDLKTPLTTIKGIAQFAQQRMLRGEQMDQDRILADLDVIDETATKMAAMVNGLLDMTRTQMGYPLEMVSRPVDLVGLARDVAEEHSQRFRHHAIEVQSGVPQLVTPLDGFRMERVLNNLLANATKYSPGGGHVLVSIDRERSEDGDWAIIRVQDGGMGIPEGDILHVFERFHRGSNVVGVIPGTGVGLSGALQIVQQVGGSIEVDSREGVGSTFTVRLPVEPESGPAEQP